MLTQSELPITRRGFLQATGLAFACALRPLVNGFSAITDDFTWLMRWCCFGSAPRLAAG